MIAPSVTNPSVSDALASPASSELHLWLCCRETVGSSDKCLREVLSHYTAVAPAQMLITRGLQGKPALAAPDLPLAFNLAGSGDWFAMVVSDGAAVGVDIEYCNSSREVLRLARRFYSPVELSDLRACTPAERVNRFYEYWTLKEAHIKAGGGSLGRELETTAFALRFAGGASRSAAVGGIAPLATALTATAWYGLAQPFDDYRLALCCCAPRDFSAGIRLFELSGSGVPVDRPLTMLAVSERPDLTPAATCLG